MVVVGKALIQDNIAVDIVAEVDNIQVVEVGSIEEECQAEVVVGIPNIGDIADIVDLMVSVVEHYFLANYEVYHLVLAFDYFSFLISGL